MAYIYKITNIINNKCYIVLQKQKKIMEILDILRKCVKVAEKLQLDINENIYNLSLCAR